MGGGRGGAGGFPKGGFGVDSADGGSGAVFRAVTVVLIDSRKGKKDWVPMGDWLRPGLRIDRGGGMCYHGDTEKQERG